MPRLEDVSDPHDVVTAIDSGMRFPDALREAVIKYKPHILLFKTLINKSSDSGNLLDRIRAKDFSADQRMALLKIFRRCVSGVCDTETTKKIEAIPTKKLIDSYGATFTPLETLKEQWGKMDDVFIASLALVVGEYDNRGLQGYVLSGQFFDWFEAKHDSEFEIRGPRGPGPDIELSTIEKGFRDSCPCDFAIFHRKSHTLKAVGFIRYDSTRGGAQSDDRTGGNSDKVKKIRDYCNIANKLIRVAFISDGPGLTHGDTWKEAVALDKSWDDNVRVATMKLVNDRITKEWILNKQ